MNKRPSIRDVARLAGVSHTKASLALRNDDRIPGKTRARVARAAEQLGYANNPVVSDLMAQLRTLKERTPDSCLAFLTAWPTQDGWKDASNHRRFYNGVA